MLVVQVQRLSLDPQHPTWKARHLALGRQSPGAHSPANLAAFVSFGFNERPRLKKESGELIEEDIYINL